MQQTANTRPLTTRQHEIVAFLRRFSANNGYPPTVREIAKHFGIRSTNGVVCHLDALEAKQLIVRDRMTSRGIRVVVDDPSPFPADAFVLFRAGDQWLATRRTFRDLQQSAAGFGRTPQDAMDALCGQEALNAASGKGA